MDLGSLTGDPALAGTEISDLAYASRDAGQGSLFFCVRGYKSDGHDFAADAVHNGAAALVCERPLGLGVPELIVEDARAAMPSIARRFFREPSAAVDVVGITGTNGKTTIAYLLRQALSALGRPCGLIGTVEWVVAGRARPAERTTPEAIDLQRALRAMADHGERVCAIEVSSHALELGRVEGVRFAAAVFTNLTQDHLDFHSSMDEYFAAKRRLFAAGPEASIVNIDDPYGRRLAEEFDCVTYSVAAAPADFRAAAIEYDASGTRFDCVAGGSVSPVTIRLPGPYNVANALAAIAVLTRLGIELEDAAGALAEAKGAPGRFELVEAGQDFSVVVDYAHTPDSLVNVLRATRGLPHERLIVVFGAGGDRDREKRPLMGAAGGEYADVVYVTSDNPRSEDPAAIVREVSAGAEAAAAASGARVEAIVDRREAINHAVSEAGPGDIVVIAGKGHEQGQEFAGGRKIPFDDAVVAREALAALIADGAGR